MALINIIIDMGSDSYSELDDLQSEKASLVKVINLLQAINSGAESASVTVEANAVQKVSTLTFSASGQVEDETFTLNGVDFTFKDTVSGGYTGTWIDIDSDYETTAENTSDCINNTSNVAVEGILGAAASSGVVTLTATRGGKSGNAITLSESATNVAAAAGASGTAGTSTTLTSG